MKRSPRLVLLACALVAVAALLPAAARPARFNSRAGLASLESNVVDGLNRVRAAHGLSALEVSPGLGLAAESHDAQMLAEGYFDHQAPRGRPFEDRMEQYYPVAGARYWSVAENLLWARWTPDGSRVVSSWMASPEHRANILDPTWREVGVSVETAASAPGVFGGHAVTIVTADFGVRKPG